MKVLPWFALLFACTAVPADAHLTFAGTPKIDLFSSARLIDTNQSQSLEAVSTADGNLRLPSYKLAGVYFITGNNGQTFDNEAKDNDFTDPTGDNCKRLGFAVTSCASGLFNRVCPYNDKIYDKCCDASYHFTASQCTSPRKLSTDTCGGKYSCLCSTSTYPFASCNDPQIKGSSCTDDKGTRYATCVCPNPVSTPYGCQTYFSDCSSKCQAAYADNCRNRTAVSTPYGCQTYFSDCSSKCQTAYADNCRNRTAVSCPYGCASKWGDCSSKCQKCKVISCNTAKSSVDNILSSGTSVSIAGQSIYNYASPSGVGCFRGQSSTALGMMELHGWSCSSCTSQSENGTVASGYNCSCVAKSKYPNASLTTGAASSARDTLCDGVVIVCPKSGCKSGYTYIGDGCVNSVGLILYGDGTVSNDLVAGKTPIGIVFDAENRLAVALTEVNEDGTAGSKAMNWSSSFYDVPDLNNSDFEISLKVSETDGRANTTAILNCGSSCGTTPAATAANSYEPIGCSADFCKKTKWFLPSMRDLITLYEAKSSVEASLDLIDSMEVTSFREAEYWSSNEYDSYNVWSMRMPDGYKNKYMKSSSIDVRPVVKY